MSFFDRFDLAPRERFFVEHLIGVLFFMLPVLVDSAATYIAPALLAAGAFLTALSNILCSFGLLGGYSYRAISHFKDLQNQNKFKQDLKVESYYPDHLGFHLAEVSLILLASFSQASILFAFIYLVSTVLAIDFEHTIAHFYKVISEHAGDELQQIESGELTKQKVDQLAQTVQKRIQNNKT